METEYLELKKWLTEYIFYHYNPHLKWTELDNL